MPRRLRLDAELVRRNFARSRDEAARLIAEGRVVLDGVAAHKPATGVTTDAPIRVLPVTGEVTYVSRGGHKLAGALTRFGPCGLEVADRLALDAGASTGGFTDVLLRAGIRRVTAVDVGYGQLAWPLRGDDRVSVLERTNIRDLTPDHLEYTPTFVVGDLSFISLRLVLPPLVAVSAASADLVLLVKPQFEVGRDRVGKGGVVREPELHVRAVMDVGNRAGELGMGVAGVCVSPLPGPAGNIEYFLWLRHDAQPVDIDTVRSVVAAGPQ